jgi:Replication-relaxation
MTAAPEVRLTPRDREVFRDVYRFGCLSAVQLAARHWPDSVSYKTARNRLWRLCGAEYLAPRPVGHREDGAYLLTPKGRAELGLPTRHARPDLRASASLRHRLVVADVADWLRSRRYRGGEPEWVTEVDIYDGGFWLARRAAGYGYGYGDNGREERERGALMVPDGVLLLRGGEREWRLAIEVELHRKASRLYDAKLAWYALQFAEGALDGCEWLCAGAGRAAPVLAAARRAAAGFVGLVAAGPLPEGVTPYATPD